LVPLNPLHRWNISTPSLQSVRRSARLVKPPDRYGFQANTAIGMEKEPLNIVVALNSSQMEKLTHAKEKEMESIYSNDVWDLVEPTEDHRVIGYRWVFKRKMNADGSIERYKAHLMAQGFSQQKGLDYNETFSPVMRFEYLRSLFAIAVQKGLNLHQLDATAAFLNGELQDLYMEKPEGFVVKGKESCVQTKSQSVRIEAKPTMLE